MVQIPRARLVLQALVAVVALVVAQQIARLLQLDSAGGVLSMTSLATLVVCARLGWRQALLGVGGLVLLSVPAVYSRNDPLLATVVLTAAGLGLGISARWQLKPVYWLLVVSLCLLITNSPLPPGPSPGDTIRMALALMASGAVATVLQGRLLSPGGCTADACPFAVVQSWRRSWAHGLMLAAATLVTTPLALAHHWHTSGLWLILTPFLVLQPFVRESWKAALHRSLGTLAGVVLVIALALSLPQSMPLLLPAIAAAALTVVIAIRQGHRALLLTTLTVTVVLFNSSHGDLLLRADQRVLASGLGIAIALMMMALAHPIERRFSSAVRISPWPEGGRGDQRQHDQPGSGG